MRDPKFSNVLWFVAVAPCSTASDPKLLNNAELVKEVPSSLNEILPLFSKEELLVTAFGCPPKLSKKTLLPAMFGFGESSIATAGRTATELIVSNILPVTMLEKTTICCVRAGLKSVETITVVLRKKSLWYEPITLLMVFLPLAQYVVP